MGTLTPKGGGGGDMLRRAIKANRKTCHYDSEGEYAEPLPEAPPIIRRPSF
jgi:hypothetical protein